MGPRTSGVRCIQIWSSVKTTLQSCWAAVVAFGLGAIPAVLTTLELLYHDPSNESVHNTVVKKKSFSWTWIHWPSLHRTGRDPGRVTRPSDTHVEFELSKLGCVNCHGWLFKGVCWIYVFRVFLKVLQFSLKRPTVIRWSHHYLYTFHRSPRHLRVTQFIDSFKQRRRSPSDYSSLTPNHVDVN